jgi:hypothetical protein
MYRLAIFGKKLWRRSRSLSLGSLVPAAAGTMAIRQRKELKATIANRLRQIWSKKSPAPKNVCASAWIIQRLYDNAVEKPVELRLLSSFQHIVDPTRVGAVADQDLPVAPLDLCPAEPD